MFQDKISLIDIIKAFDLKTDGRELMAAGGWAAAGWLPLIAVRMIAVNKFGADLFPLSWPETFWLFTGTMTGSAMSAATIEAMIRDIKARVR